MDAKNEREGGLALAKTVAKHLGPTASNPRDDASLGVDLLGPPKLRPQARVSSGWPAVEVALGMLLMLRKGD